MPIERAAPPPPGQRAKRAAGTPVRSGRTAAREAALNEYGQIGSLIAVMKGWYADAGAVAQHGPGFFHEMALMGEDNEQIASWLDYLTQTGPAAGLIKAGLPFAMQIAANHGRLDASKLPPEAGIIDPALLEKRVKAEMSLASARILEEIRALEAKAVEAGKSIPGTVI